MRKITFLVAAILLVLLAGCSKVEDGIQAYNSENYAEALKILTPLAKRGDAKAQEFLGLIYGKGLGVPVDVTEAFKWFKVRMWIYRSTQRLDIGLLVKMSYVRRVTHL